MSFNSIEFDCGFYVTEALADTLYSRAPLNPEPPAGCHMELELVDMGSNTCSIKCKGVCPTGKGCQLLHEKITDDNVLKVYCECEDKTK